MTNYIAANCPALSATLKCIDSNKFCVDRNDCVIKQVIAKCKCYDNADFENHIAPFARGIINMFEIEVTND